MATVSVGERVMITPVAIWDESQWCEADRKTWPSGRTEYVIVECEPALGVLNVGRVVLAAEALDELAAAKAPDDFGGDEVDAWLVIGIVERRSRADDRARKRSS